jgi:hypothetical protein
MTIFTTARVALLFVTALLVGCSAGPDDEETGSDEAPLGGDCASGASNCVPTSATDAEVASLALLLLRQFGGDVIDARAFTIDGTGRLVADPVRFGGQAAAVQRVLDGLRFDRGAESSLYRRVRLGKDTCEVRLEQGTASTARLAPGALQALAAETDQPAFGFGKFPDPSPLRAGELAVFVVSKAYPLRHEFAALAQPIFVHPYGTRPVCTPFDSAAFRTLEAGTHLEPSACMAAGYPPVAPCVRDTLSLRVLPYATKQATDYGFGLPTRPHAAPRTLFLADPTQHCAYAKNGRFVHSPAQPFATFTRDLGVIHAACP